MEWRTGQIEGVVLKELKKNLDQRGFLCETFRADQLPEELHPAMSYVSYTEPGVNRGPHEHLWQTDIFSFLGPGNFLLRLWDNRESSITYGYCMDIYAGRDNPLAVIIPPGVVHGYKNISKQEIGMVLNFPNKLYKGREKKEDVDEIRHEADPRSQFKMES